MQYRKIASHVLPTGYPMRLTKANVAKLSLPEGKNELLVFDEALAGFGTSPIWRQADLHRPIHRIGSKQRRLSLGSSETLDAEEARKRGQNGAVEGQPRHRSSDRKNRWASEGVRHDRSYSGELLGAPRIPSQAELLGRCASVSARPLGSTPRSRRPFSHAVHGSRRRMV